VAAVIHVAMMAGFSNRQLDLATTWVSGADVR